MCGRHRSLGKIELFKTKCDIEEIKKIAFVILLKFTNISNESFTSAILIQQ